MSNTALKQAILFFGVVSFFLGKAALNGAGPRVQADPLLRSLREAGVV
jgi:hypothetical protein